MGKPRICRRIDHRRRETERKCAVSALSQESMRQALREKTYRFDGSVVRTPEVVLVSAEGGRLVLLGMCHIAEPQYYQSMRELLSAEEHWGSVVFYEAVKRSDGFLITVPRVIDIVMRFLSHYASESIRFQKDEIKIQGYWIHSDIDARTLYRYAPLFSRMLLSLSARCGRRLCFVFGVAGLLFARHVVVTLRNRYALRVVREYFRGCSPVRGVLVWGAGHVPGMVEELVSRDGYAVESITWHRALQFDFTAGNSKEAR